eukprot:2152317-Amphidinium_carterae.1
MLRKHRVQAREVGSCVGHRHLNSFALSKSDQEAKGVTRRFDCVCTAVGEHVCPVHYVIYWGISTVLHGRAPLLYSQLHKATLCRNGR